MNLKLYELNYLMPAHFAPQEQKSISEKVVSLLQKQEAVILEEKTAVAQKLAYPIKKQSMAFLATINFKADPQKITAIEEGLRLENKILRFYLLTKKIFAWQEKRKEKEEVKEAVLPALPDRQAGGRQEKEGEKVGLKEIDKKLKEIFGE